MNLFEREIKSPSSATKVNIHYISLETRHHHKKAEVIQDNISLTQKRTPKIN